MLYLFIYFISTITKGYAIVSQLGHLRIRNISSDSKNPSLDSIPDLKKSLSMVFLQDESVDTAAKFYGNAYDCFFFFFFFFSFLKFNIVNLEIDQYEVSLSEMRLHLDSMHYSQEQKLDSIELINKCSAEYV